METRFKGEAAHPHPHPPPPPPHHHQLYNMNSVDLRAVGKRTLEWDLNDWKWDGDLFIATPLNPVPPRPFFPSGSEIPAPIGGGGGGSSNSSSSCSEELNLGSQKEKKESMEKKKRRVVVVKDYSSNDETATLGLNLGRNGFSVGERVVVGNWEESNGKNTKLVAGNSSRSICQVEDCGADLSGAKDYHRRHKVCEMHSKASRALVGNVMQRFCQQCSRFHVLQEFDEGKRSCRRRLAGHNKRRRKTNPGTAVNTSSSADNQNSGYLIISLLKILSNMHSQKSDQAMDQDLLSHLLRSLASSQTNEHGRENLSGLLEKSQNFPSNGRLIGASELASTFPSNCPQGSPGPSKPHNTLTFLETPQQGKHAHNNAQVEDTQTTLTSVKPSIVNSPLAYSEVRASAVGISKVNKFDLNDIFIDSDDGTEDMERSHVPTNLGTGFHGCPSWVQNDCHQSSPPHPSGNSDSACTQSPSSSNGEAQSRTDRIVFKLFGKEPNDFPMVLRTQILDWLSHSPTDIESYIRPGCVILTIYLRQTATAWEELCYDLRSSLNRLLQASDDDDAFWRSGWVYVRIHNQIAFIHHGQVVVDRSLTLRRNHHSKIISVKPIAITASDKARISVRGSNLFGPATRLLCALGGKYLIQKDTDESMINFESSEKQDDLQCMSFSCSVPIVNGRGFIEVEDHGLSSSFFPFIVAEEDVCSEIRILETALEFTEMYSESSDSLEECRKMEEVRSQAMDFIDEMGWLLHRSQLKSRLGHLNPNPNLFPLERYKWLVEFSMDRDWCAVLKKLLDILLDGTVSIGESNSLNLALLELGLLHRAVRRNSRSLVEFLLRYTSKKESVSVDEEAGVDFLFRPDHVGPGSLTPLHIAAGKDGSEDVIDALTDDPRMVGIKAWKNSRDSTGFTPEDYARLRGHYSYIHLVQKKINKRTTPPPPEHIVLNIPSSLPDTSSSNEKQNNELATGLEIEARRAIQQACRLCDQKPACRISSKAFVYRPAMLSMVAIAAVCVCVALLFKSSPEVFYVFRPFRWESLRYGTS